MKPVKGGDLHVNEPLAFQLPLKPPPEERRLLGCIAQSLLKPWYVLLEEDLGVQHVRFRKSGRSPRSKQTTDPLQSSFQLQVMEHGRTYDRIEWVGRPIILEPPNQELDVDKGPTSSPRFVQKLGRQIQRHDVGSGACEKLGKDSGPAADLQDPHPGT